MVSLSRFLVGLCGFPSTTAARSTLVRFNSNREDSTILRQGRCIVKDHVCSGGQGTVVMLLAMTVVRK